VTRDITEGRSTRAIAVDIGLNAQTIWQNTGNSYDCAIAGIPFLTAIRDDRPYERATAPFRKQQFDSQRDPGEQSLSAWWLRSQSSFHTGEGIKFYDPLANPYSTTIASNSYRYKVSRGVEVMDAQGNVTLLRRPVKTQTTSTAASLETVTISGVDKVLVQDATTLKITDGTTSAMTTISAGVSGDIYTSCNDGINAYYIDAANIVKVALTGGSTSSVRAVTGTTSATMSYVKQRIVAGINNAIYEFPTLTVSSYTVTYTQLDNTTNTATFTTSVNHSLRVGDRIVVASIATNAADYNGTYRVTATTPNTVTVFNTGTNHNLTSQSAGTLTLSANTPVYTHPNTNWVWTSIAEGGTAIYAAGYAGANSAVYKFNLDTAGAMPTLTSGIIAAVLPDGEVIHNIFVHLMTYILIGTNKGVRVGTIDPNNGNITYGPLMIQTERPVRGFAAHNAYVYACSSFYDSVTNNNIPGIYRIDLSTEIDNLRFAYQADVYPEDVNTGEAIDVCWLGRSDQLVFLCGTVNNAVVTVGDLGIYTQSATELYPSGYIETGQIRYNTLEPKNFKRIVARGEFTSGSMTISTIDSTNHQYDLINYDTIVGSPEVTITQPSGAQDSVGLRFTLYRNTDTISSGPVFHGYQLKAVPATPRSRLITIPLMNFDTETDKYNSTIGYEGRAIERLAALENAESAGDVVTWQDFRTGELAQCLIEEVKFTDITPPDKRLTGYGGIITLTIRTV
jgi:hypothetical protein